MTVQVTDLSQKTFDYVIVGAGTAGLTLAARLSEDPSVTVAVIEAGQSHINDPKIVVPGQFGQTLGDPKYDWRFVTTKQKHSNNREYTWNRGKGLGGTSCMSFYAWIKPPAGDVNKFEKLGNKGWNWAEFDKYSKRSETFHAAAKEQADLYPHTYEPEYRGTSGPIQTTVPYHVHTIDALFQETMVNMGLKAIKDPYGGDITGTWMASANLDPKTWTRSSTVTAYLVPNQDRPNLTVLTEATVSLVLFSEATAGQDLAATGVEFIHDGEKHSVYAKKEVILSAGTIKSPHILELSGIGRPDILSKIGVDVKVDLPGVGENIQDHTYLSVSYELNPNAAHKTYDLMRDPEYAALALKLHAEGKGPQRLGFTSFADFPLSAATKDAPALIEKVVQGVEELKQSGKLATGLAEQLDLQVETLRDDSLPDMEIIAFPSLFTTLSAPEPGKNYVTILLANNHPFSRGTIHATSKDPLAYPEIDPHYMENDFDLESMVQHIKFIRSMADVEPWKSGIVREVDPGLEVKTDEQIREHVKQCQQTAWHTIGSCSMLPREKQGVVDSNLKVYGTTNVRVVDISIIPIHIAAHTHATAIMIGEKAADLIRGIV